MQPNPQPECRKGELKTWDDVDALATRTVRYWSLPYMQTAFRGTSRPWKDLKPTLTRMHHADPGPAQAYKCLEILEVVLRDELKRRSSQGQIPGLESERWLDVLTGLAHFGAPTRLLDWTSSPLVALYFACKEDLEEPGIVWEVSAHGVNEFNELEGPYLDDAPMIDDWIEVHQGPAKIGFVWPRSHNERSAAQMGLFSIASDPALDHFPLLVDAGNKLMRRHGNDWADHTLVRYEVPAACKREFLRQLWVRNIHSAALFPGSAGLCGYASDLVRLYKLSQNESYRKLDELAQATPLPDVESLLKADSS